MDAATPLLRVVHMTRYVFEEVATGDASLRLHLEPAGAASHQIVVRPLPASVRTARDAFGNGEASVLVRAPFGTLTVTAVSVAPAAEVFPTGGRGLAGESPHVPRLPACEHYARAHLRAPSRAGVEALVAQIGRDFAFDPRATQPEGHAGLERPDAALRRFVERRRGVCQDFAHFAIGCLRASGLPACYFSGYLAKPGICEASHAWAAVLLPHEGWLSLDPTHGRVGPPGHLTLAVGRDYQDVAPVTGTLAHRGGCRLSTSVTVSCGA